MTFDILNLLLIAVVLFTALTFGVLGAIGSYDPEKNPTPPTFEAAVRESATNFARFALMFTALNLVLHRDEFWAWESSTLALFLGLELVVLAVHAILIRRRQQRAQR